MEPPRLPPDLQQAAWSAALTWLLAILGRLLWHVQEVQKKRRLFFSWHLLWELITALAIGFVADGVAAYFDLSGKAAVSVIIIVSYLGPRGIEMLIERVLDRVGAPRQ